MRYNCCTGKAHSIFLTSSGEVHGVGANELVQLGHDKETMSKITRQVPLLPTIDKISCGLNFTICLDFSGYIWSFGCPAKQKLGYESYCSLGRGPQKIEQITDFISEISCGDEHTLCISSNGELWSFGYNNLGQLCAGHNEVLYEPCKTIYTNVQYICGGKSRSYFINEENQIFTCGGNFFGRLGLGNTQPETTPVQISTLPLNIISIACGDDHTLFLDRDGNVYGTGKNSNGQLGLKNKNNRSSPGKLNDLPPVHTISCGVNFSLCVDFDGNLWAFGNHLLGDSKTNNCSVPTLINSLSGIEQVSRGLSEFAFLKDNSGRVFCFGKNYENQLGDIDNKVVSGFPKVLNERNWELFGTTKRYCAKSARK